MKTSFSEGKLMKQFGNTLFLREALLSTKPPISEQFFMTSLFAQILKTRNPCALCALKPLTVRKPLFSECYLLFSERKLHFSEC